ncbi:DNA polymerase lambda isoform X1 [Nymphaea colorata]|nr:DNA polymerase lambda isoform X1 [Nymphaea colorata]
MAPKSKTTPKKKQSGPKHEPDAGGMFSGKVFFLVEKGVQPRRIQIWKQKLLQMGAVVEDNLSKTVTHVLAAASKFLLQEANPQRLIDMKFSLLSFQWLEDSLKQGARAVEDPYRIVLEQKSIQEVDQSVTGVVLGSTEGNASDEVVKSGKKAKLTDDTNIARGEASEGSEDLGKTSVQTDEEQTMLRDRYPSDSEMEKSSAESSAGTLQSDFDSSVSDKRNNGETSDQDASSLYKPPDLNRNVTEIFGKLINIYRALGDDRRSFSYYKAIPVIEKLPFKIQNVDRVKHLPAIGKAMQDHIHEIVTTGKLSKLEHFENDEKVKTISLFGEVWGIGPATALKLYEKGHRTLDDLSKDDSLTHAQRLGVKYFDDIKKRIPRDEVKVMEEILQKVGKDVLPGVIIVIGGSYRRGKATCGDLDVVITHPDGRSHKGFLPKFVKHLKDMKFLREDLVFSTHSMEGTDSGVDTYFGLCTYPGREQRLRIDFKVYPRDIYAFGLIAWTGNDVLNRRLRLLAESKGFRLDDTGLYLVSHSPTGKKVTKSNTRLTCKTEREVLDVLGFPWLEPHERNL